MTYKLLDDRLTRITITIPKDMLKRFDLYKAKNNWRSRSRLIVKAMDYYITPQTESAVEDSLVKGVIMFSYGVKNESTPRAIQEKMYYKGSCVSALKTYKVKEDTFFVYGFVEGWISEITELITSLQNIGGVVDVGLVRLNDELSLMSGLPQLKEAE